MALSKSNKFELAKSLTELAIQNNLINQCSKPKILRKK